MNKTFINKDGERIECVEITTLYPATQFHKRNAQQRQDAADQNNGGKLGNAKRFAVISQGQEGWVDIDSKVWWVEDFR